MPGLDRSGPNGEGSMTGGGFGPCNTNNQQALGRGRGGVGLGCGRGMGRGANRGRFSVGVNNQPGINQTQTQNNSPIINDE